VSIRNVILDWSGTIFDDLDPVIRTTNHVFAQYGLPAMSREEFRREFRLPVKRFYDERLPHVTVAELERVFVEKHPEHHHGIQPLPDTAAFLTFCHAQGLPTFIASTVDELTYHSQMKRFGLDHLITRAYLGIADKSEAIHRILEENELDPRATVFVGDMEHDIEAGQAGGVITCAVLTGYNDETTLRAMRPDLVCANLTELQQWLTQPPVSHG
jgi:phosphoglycolate phosphatase